MDLRVFFYRKFVVGQGRERSIARKFLEKMRKSKKKHLLCYIENVGANIVRPPTIHWHSSPGQCLLPIPRRGGFHIRLRRSPHHSPSPERR